MREILFKAKRLDNGEWVEGTPIFNPDMSKGKILSFAKDLGNNEISFYHYAVDSSTVCQYTGKQIFQNESTKSYLEPVKVYENDLIAIYTITYDDDDTPVRTRIAVVRVGWDDTYKMLFAQCVEGDMDTIAKECDISYLDSSNDYPFTFWLEYMENSAGKWWEMEVIGNIHDKAVEDA